MAFYFALMNVSKKDDRNSGNQHRKHHRRHSIASVESPLLDYRLLPRPKLLDDEDVVIPNPTALEESFTSETRRSRGSARASKWVQDNQRHANGPSSSRSQGDLHDSPKISRSKRMAFPAGGGGGASSESPRRGKQKPSRLPVRRPTQGTSLKPCRVHVERALHVSHESSATDDSRRSSHDSMTPMPRREDSPASSCEGASTSMAKLSLTNNEPRMKKVTFENSPYVISNSFLGDRAVLVRRGSGTAVRLISDAATLPIQTLLCTTTKVLAPHDEVCGDDWWTPCGDHRSATGEEGNRRQETPDHVVVDNRANERIERLQNGRRRLLRRRSTSDKRIILEFRNSGFLDKSQERTSG